MDNKTTKEERLAEMIRRAQALKTPMPLLIAHWEKILTEARKKNR